jgi:hypothetical protein
VLDRQGRLRLFGPYGAGAKALLHDIRLFAERVRRGYREVTSSPSQGFCARPSGGIGPGWVSFAASLHDCSSIVCRAAPGTRPGLILFVQTFRDPANFNPHLPARLRVRPTTLATDWPREKSAIDFPVRSVDHFSSQHAALKVYRHDRQCCGERKDQHGGVAMSASSSGNRRMVTGLFADGESAERAYQACVERGYDIGEVNVLMSEDTRTRLLSDDSEITTRLASKEAEGGELGGPRGGDIGILVTILAAVGAALALPALGFVVAGPIAVALAGAGAAGLAAGLIGALGDWGIPEERVRGYEKGIHDGGILMMVEVRSDEDARRIEQQWTAIGGRDVYCC